MTSHHQTSETVLAPVKQVESRRVILGSDEPQMNTDEHGLE